MLCVFNLHNYDLYWLCVCVFSFIVSSSTSCTFVLHLGYLGLLSLCAVCVFSVCQLSYCQIKLIIITFTIHCCLLFYRSLSKNSSLSQTLLNTDCLNLTFGLYWRLHILYNVFRFPNAYWLLSGPSFSYQQLKCCDCCLSVCLSVCVDVDEGGKLVILRAHT